MAANNLVLQLLITARDEATSVISRIFGALNDSTNVIATKIREAFTGVFNITDEAQAFEAQLARVQAKANASQEDMARLKQAALDMGRQMGVSATDAAQGLEILTGAGLSVNQAIAALGPTLRVVATEQVSAAEAAGALTDVMSLMGVSLEQAGRAGDVLQAGADATSTSVIGLAEAMRGAGAAASGAGLTLEQTTTILTAFAKFGLKGSEAGTALAGMMDQLNDPTSKARAELAKLGQTTGDVSEMIGTLTKAGPRGSAAMLAFGDAQSGVNALLKTGVQGFADFGVAIDKAGGGLEKAADTIVNTLIGALGGLSASWQQIKLALTEPLLKPLADAAKTTADVLNNALKEGALKPLQEAIKTFAVNSAASVQDFIKSFDFNQAVAALDGFWNSAKTSFEGIKNAGTTTADAVTIAWNAVTAGFNTIGAAMLTIASKTMSALAATEEAASKIGLGSQERANELRQTANDLAGAAQELVAKVAQDGAEMGAAFNRMTGATDSATAAQERLKAALPTPELQAINYTLQDYQTLADRANAAVDAGRIAHEAGTLSAQEYGQRLLEAADANKALADAATAQAQQTEKSGAAAAELATKMKEYNREIKAGNDNAADWRSGMELNGVKMLGLRDAATATAEKLAYLQSIQATLPDADRQIAEAKQAATQAQNRYNTALTENITQQERHLEAIQRSNALEQTSTDLKIQQAQTEAELARLKGDTVGAMRAENEALDLQIDKMTQAAAKKQEEIAAYTDLIAATKMKLEQDGTLDASDQNQLATMADTLAALKLEKEQTEQNAQSTRDLADAKQKQKEASDAAAAAEKALADAEKEAAAQRVAAGDAVNSNFAAANKVLVETGGNLEELNKAFIALQESSNRTAIGWDAWARNTANAADTVVQAFHDQKNAVDDAVAALDAFAQTGKFTAQTQQALNLSTRDTRTAFNLLNDADLSKLQDAIDTAKGKMDDLRQASEEALAAAQQTLLQEQGDTVGVLRLQQKKDELKLQNKINEAKAFGDKEAIANLEKARDLELQAYELKLKKAEADKKANASPSTGSAATSGDTTKRFALDLNGAGKTLNAYSAEDPTDFLTAIERAQKTGL